MKNHKIIARVLKYIAAAYVAACIALSVLVSSGVLRWEILERRAPFLIVDVAVTSVEEATARDTITAMTSTANISAFAAVRKNTPKG